MFKVWPEDAGLLLTVPCHKNCLSTDHVTIKTVNYSNLLLLVLGVFGLLSSIILTIVLENYTAFASLKEAMHNVFFYVISSIINQSLTDYFEFVKNCYVYQNKITVLKLSVLDTTDRSSASGPSQFRFQITPWLIKLGGSLLHWQGLSNNSFYPESNQPNSSYWYPLLWDPF